jgi:polysaccharide deacetylase family protein (PEP-CTERM system associated)
MKNIITFDLEEWYHILDIPYPLEYSFGPKISFHTQNSLEKILDLLSIHGVTCTFFVLGKLAENNPEIVSKIHSAHHEIASHGYNHDLITSLNPDQFRSDIRRSKNILEDITGKPVLGYRGPGFSITAKNLWAFDVIAEEGYAYDATTYPGYHGHGGLPGMPVAPFILKTEKGGELEEYPVTLFNLMITKTAFAGGGYFRLFPYILISSFYKLMNRKNIPVTSYFHARDFDPNVPRVPMPIHRRFKCYVNLKKTYPKLAKIIKKYPSCSIRDWKSQGATLPTIQINSKSNPSFLWGGWH